MAGAALLYAQALYVFAPLLFAAAISAVVLRFDLARILRLPIDFGATFHGQRVFGDSKTWRGVVNAVVGAVIAVALQRAAQRFVPAWLQVIDYSRTSAWALGTAMGAGAMLGELPNSFVKRRLGIAPGATATGARAVVFYLWDQLDLLTGAWPLLACWVRPSLGLVLASVVVALTLHPLVALVGWLVGARKSPR